MEVDRVQTNWNWWDDDAKDMTGNHEQEHETDENQINYDCKGGKGKGGQWQATRKGDGKGSKGGWTSAVVKACFGCGSTTHLIQDCLHRTPQKVQEVRDEADEPEILFIGHHLDDVRPRALAQSYSQKKDVQKIAVRNASRTGGGDQDEIPGF